MEKSKRLADRWTVLVRQLRALLLYGPAALFSLTEKQGAFDPGSDDGYRKGGHYTQTVTFPLIRINDAGESESVAVQGGIKPLLAAIRAVEAELTALGVAVPARISVEDAEKIRIASTLRRRVLKVGAEVEKAEQLVNVECLGRYPGIAEKFYYELRDPNRTNWWATRVVLQRRLGRAEKYLVWLKSLVR